MAIPSMPPSPEFPFILLDTKIKLIMEFSKQDDAEAFAKESIDRILEGVFYVQLGQGIFYYSVQKLCRLAPDFLAQECHPAGVLLRDFVQTLTTSSDREISEIVGKRELLPPELKEGREDREIYEMLTRDEIDSDKFRNWLFRL